MANLIEAGKRGRDLVGQILRFSRQEKSQKGPLSVSAVVKEVIQLLRSTLPSTIQIDSRVDRGSLMIVADATQIHQMVMNLCTNAYQSMGNKHGTLGIILEKVTLESEKSYLSMSIAPGEYVRLTVTDTGKGIPPEIIEKIFNPYFTTKFAGEGTGLGLSVTIGVVQEHGGLIETRSEPETGTSFRVYLPFEQKTPKVEKASEVYVHTGRHEEIMVVDDQRFFLDVAREHLGSLDYSVEAFSSSSAALKRFQEDPDKFHLVISDQTMPEMTGLQLISELRRIRADIPILLCTGYNDTATENQLNHAENLKLLMKPVTRRELAEAVYDALQPGNTPEPRASADNRDVD